MTLTVDITATMILSSGAFPLEVEMAYDPADPLAVHLEFMENEDPDENITWTFARDLLHKGLREPAGTGDVKLRPFTGHIELTIQSDDGMAVFELPRAEVERFLQRTFKLVGLGHEKVDVDSAIQRLLAA